MATLAKLPPAFVPGADMTKFIHAGLFKVKSADVAYNATSPVALFEVLPNTMVVDLIVQIATAFNGTTPSVTVGDGDDADGFFDSASLVPGTVGYKSIKQDTQPYSGGKLYAAADTIDVAITITDTSAGLLRAWLIYAPFDDEAL